jgi:hypothetical protein
MQITNALARKSSGKRFFCTALTALAAVAFSTAACAQQIAGWTDSNGQVTYSNLTPPRGAKVTDIIPDTPLSTQAVQEATRRSEIYALNDRIRLLEFEQARSWREVADYPAQPVPPLSSGCSLDGYGNCNSQWGRYYTTGFLYGTAVRRGYEGHDFGHNNGRPGHAPNHVAPPPKLCRPRPLLPARTGARCSSDE